MKKYILTAIIAAALLTACDKEYEENQIPEDVPGLADIQAAYTKTLASEPLGWYVEYSPTSDPTTISILVRFHEDGTASMISDYQGYTEEQSDVRFRVGGNIKPELIFESYSVWHAIAENIGGRFEFYITPAGENSFTLTQVNGVINRQYTLRKAAATDEELIRSKARTALLLQDFAANASAYFKNLELPGLSAFWELDTDKQTLTLTWPETSGEPKSETYSYNYVHDGIALSSPFLIGSARIDTLLFGAMTGNSLEVLRAGNAGAGQITVSHTPAFPYRGTANLFMRIENELPRFFAYTLDDMDLYYSKDLQPYIIVLRNSISPEMLRIQLYHYNMNATGTTPANQLYSMQLLTRNGSGTSVFLPYYTSLEKKDESHVVVTPLGTTNSNGAPYLSEVLNFMNIIFPPEGVTIVPDGRSGSLQKLRVVSRKNSKIYFSVIVSTPTGIYVD